MFLWKGFWSNWYANIDAAASGWASVANHPGGPMILSGEKKNLLARIAKYINMTLTILGYFPLISSLMYVRGVQYFWRATFPWRPWKSVAILKTLISWSGRRYWHAQNPGFLVEMSLLLLHTIISEVYSIYTAGTQ